MVQNRIEKKKDFDIFSFYQSGSSKKRKAGGKVNYTSALSFIIVRKLYYNKEDIVNFKSTCITQFYMNIILYNFDKC